MWIDVMNLGQGTEILQAVHVYKWVLDRFQPLYDKAGQLQAGAVEQRLDKVMVGEFTKRDRNDLIDDDK